MDNTIAIETIQATKTYQALSNTQQTFSVKRENRKILTNALIVVKNGCAIPGTIAGYNIGILNDLLKR